VQYFASLDIPVFEVFGQSECTGPHTISMEGAWKIGIYIYMFAHKLRENNGLDSVYKGYCGRPIPGSESILFPGTGELCYRFINTALFHTLEFFVFTLSLTL
jgi:long-chain-fatty-acid--CoA ligase ACSBG